MTAASNPAHGPIVIAGLGGSGTRVVAQILRRAGVFIGSDLNAAFDNLWFTLLFKRPGWFRECSARGSDGVERALEAFEKAMVGTGPWTDDQRDLLLAAAQGMSVSGHDHLGSGRGEWPSIRVRNMLDDARPTAGARRVWGWKEPNTHIYLPELARYFPGLWFVLVVRPGLDMAFSTNQNQLHMWGDLWGVAVEDPIPRSQLRYWVASTRACLERGTRLLGARFVVVSYDRLCLDPSTEVPRMLAAMGMETTAPMGTLAEVPSAPDTIGRHRGHDLSIFTAADLAEAQELEEQLGLR